MAAKYQARTAVEPIFTTELNGLTNGSRAISAEFSNDLERTLFASCILSLGTTSAKTAQSVKMWVITEVGGVYQSGGVADAPTSGFVNSFIFPKSTAAWKDIIRRVSLSNSKFKIVVENNTGVAFPATGNTLDMETTTYEDV